MNQIPPDVAEELEARGVDSARQLLGAFFSDPTAETEPRRTLQIGKAVASRGQVESWLARKAAEAERETARRHAEQVSVGKAGADWA